MKMKFKKKKTKQIHPGSELGATALETFALCNEPHTTSLTSGSNLQYIKCYHNSKYEPSMFLAIFRHKKLQNVDPKAVGIVKMKTLRQFGENIYSLST